jgi:hypothetical protein
MCTIVFMNVIGIDSFWLFVMYYQGSAQDFLSGSKVFHINYAAIVLYYHHIQIYNACMHNTHNIQ